MEPGAPGGESCTGTCHLSSQVFRAGDCTLRVDGFNWVGLGWNLRIQRAEGETSEDVGNARAHLCPGAASAACSDSPFLVECAAHGE